MSITLTSFSLCSSRLRLSWRSLSSPHRSVYYLRLFVYCHPSLLNSFCPWVHTWAFTVTFVATFSNLSLLITRMHSRCFHTRYDELCAPLFADILQECEECVWLPHSSRLSLGANLSECRLTCTSSKCSYTCTYAEDAYLIRTWVKWPECN